jgi:hypothetical protein
MGARDATAAAAAISMCEVVAWPFVVITVCGSCACSLIVKKMLVEKKC